MGGLLSLVIFLPVAGAGLLALVGNRDGGRNGLVRQAALGIALLTFVGTLALWRGFDPAGAEYQFVERVSWVPTFSIEYFVGIDGISLMLIVLTGFLTPVTLLSSWGSIKSSAPHFSL